jgi:hypothetical protein
MGDVVKNPSLSLASWRPLVMWSADHALARHL